MNRTKKIICIITIFCLLVFLAPAKSSAFLTPQSLPISSNAPYCITDSSGANVGYSVEIEFPGGFDLSDLIISDTESVSEVSVWYGDPECGGGGAGVERITEATAIADDDRDLAVITGDKIKIILEDAIPESSIGIKFTDKTDGNANAIITPSVANAYKVIFRIYDDSDVLAETYEDIAYVGNNGEVNITGNIDPTLTLDLSSTTCDLGALSSTNIKTCSYSTTVSTNGVSGYNSFITADGAFRNSTHSFTGAIGSVDFGTEIYGVSTTSQMGAVSLTMMTDINSDSFINQGDCADLNENTTSAPANGIDNSGSWIFAVSNEAIATDVTYLCHAASITDTTPAGSYAQLVTVTTVANF
jgi:hypothetical protein